MEGFKKEFEEQYAKQRKNTHKKLPQKGIPVEQIMAEVKRGEKESQVCWLDNKTSGSVYTSDVKHWDFINEVMSRFVQTNALHMDEY